MVKEFKVIKKLIILGKLAPLCALCGQPIKKADDLSQDHIVPVSKGGKTEIENLQMTHKKCNNDRGNLSMEEWEVIRKMMER